MTSESGHPPRERRSQIRDALEATHEPGGMREALDAATDIAEPEYDGPLDDWAGLRQPRWRELAARVKPASRRAAAWAWGLVGGVLAAVIGSLIYAWLSSH
jgi:hypothetical protein